MLKNVSSAVVRLNVPRKLADNLVGKDHSFRHRFVFGLIMMAIGVTIAKHAGHSHNEFVAFAGDGIGYLVHGLGTMPIAEALLGLAE